ncbi:MAG: CHAT domain-containing protein [Nevskia sp.]|nr:CHAT domain-containing protein [Nevskia sp.]
MNASFAPQGCAAAAVKYPAPGVGKLGAAQREPFCALLAGLEATRFDPKTLGEQKPDLTARMSALCASDEDQGRMLLQLDDWVRWERLRGYYLANLFQAAMQARHEMMFVPACLLYADAQNHLAEDLSLNSLENAYTAWNSVCDALGAQAAANPALAKISDELFRRLRMTYGYYRRLYSPESYEHTNPLAENLYFYKAWIDLRLAFPELAGSFAKATPAALQSVIERCAPEDIYCRVVARRSLGLVHSAAGDLAAAAAAYRQALDEAQQSRLDSEIGHLHRLLGWSLMKLGHIDDAEKEQIAALGHEQNLRFGYWQALSLAELGDVRMRRLGHSFDPAKAPPALAGVSEAYAGSIHTFERVVAMQVLPVARAVKQQLMRSYADNALEVAALRPGDLVAAIEAFGPRYANDLVAEARVAAALDAPAYARFRQARALVHKDLAVLSMGADPNEELERYLTNVVANRSERRHYLEFRNTHTVPIAASQMVQHVVQRMQALRIPDTLLLLVSVERTRTQLVLVDATAGQPVPPICLPIAARSWEQAHDTYDAAVRAASREDPRNPDRAAMERALDGLIGFYSESFAPVLEPLAPVLKGRHLKFFPRGRMNQAPLHAMKVGGQRLIELCDLSYAPSLTLFLQLHQPRAEVPATLSFLHDARGAPLYPGTLQALQAQAPAAVKVAPPTWPELRAQLERQPATDLFFGCHGEFNSDAPDHSRLLFSRRERVEFAQMFAELDLRGCRSVLMGACESGLGRTLVAAEYIGLPLAFFAAGVPYVIGTLWRVPQAPAAILVAEHYALLLAGKGSVTQCLNQALRRLQTMDQGEVLDWVLRFVPERLQEVERGIQALGERPFAHPYYWAGFYASGDA